MPPMRLVLAFVALTGLVACPTPKSPKGPPPEYEEPPAPSWLDGGAASEGGGGADGGAGADGATGPAALLR
ncbi:MAG: hypothetical protein JWO86_7062 [Myxococcaceae bacterium]|jgi:hypothetical protein|nr:hypothetical protein [Myxococcaceae bacterium]MEA2749254.1 hypothetical protein [Myxococcales bacterium]